MHLRLNSTNNRLNPTPVQIGRVSRLRTDFIRTFNGSQRLLRPGGAPKAS